MAVTKRKRAHKVSKGEHGAKRYPLSPLQKVLAGKGQFAAFEPVECKTPWRGLGEPSKPVYNPAQVEVNKRLYPHLFTTKELR